MSANARFYTGPHTISYELMWVGMGNKRMEITIAKADNMRMGNYVSLSTWGAFKLGLAIAYVSATSILRRGTPIANSKNRVR